MTDTTNKLTKLGARRLLKLAKILDTADAIAKKNGSPTYRQDAYEHDCGTPACAWGHYSFHTRRLNNWRDGKLVNTWGVEAEKEFGITWDEAWSIFSSEGMGHARTAKAAARYIRAFVKRKGVE
jgi:hypothetical protein